MAARHAPQHLAHGRCPALTLTPVSGLAYAAIDPVRNLRPRALDRLALCSALRPRQHLTYAALLSPVNQALSGRPNSLASRRRLVPTALDRKIQEEDNRIDNSIC